MSELQDCLAALNSLPIFSDIPNEYGSTLATCCRMVTTVKGAQLLQENSRATGLFVLVEGVVKVTRCTPEGREVVLYLVRKGQPLGESGVFPRGAHSADAYAVSKVKALFIPLDALDNLLKTSPETCLRLLTTLSLRLRMFSHKIKIERQGNATRRLATYLLHRSQLTGGGECIELEVSREVLANLLGLARETLSRQLTRLAAAGILSLAGKRVHILQRDELVRLAASSGGKANAGS